MDDNQRPWGYYEVLSDREDYKVKRIVVYPGKRLSLQRHKKRKEHWFIIKGIAEVTKADEQFILKTGDSINIDRYENHRIMNRSSDDLYLIEIQTGEYFGEDDIERLEDDFGRI